MQHRDTVTEAIASVLAREPDMTALPPAASPRLVELLRRHGSRLEGRKRIANQRPVPTIRRLLPRPGEYPAGNDDRKAAGAMETFAGGEGAAREVEIGHHVRNPSRRAALPDPPGKALAARYETRVVEVGEAPR